MFQTFWLHSSVFALKKTPRNLNFQKVFLPSREPLVATFNDTRVPTARKYLAGQDTVMPN